MVRWKFEATYPGNGPNSSDGMLTFDPGAYKSRPALLLVNGVVYLSFSSNCDNPPFNGWIMAYNGGTLTQEAVFNTTPNGANGALWGSGSGPSRRCTRAIFIKW